MDPLEGEKALQKSIRDQISASEGRPSRWPWLVAVVLVAAALVLVVVYWGGDDKADKVQKLTQSPGRTAPPASATGQAMPGQAPAPPGPLAEGGVVKVAPGKPATGAAADLQAQRKKPYGLDKSLDAVVRTDEKIQVGDTVVSVEDLERKLVVEQRKELLDKPLDQARKISAWGVHVVRPGENLWDIHLRLLGEYMSNKHVNLAKGADQPDPQGYSSGVGKILKFAEHMVGVYNVKTDKMSPNLNVLEPGTKVVVFNLSEIFAQLAKINPRDLSGVMYDGRVLLFPQPKDNGGVKQ